MKHLTNSRIIVPLIFTTILSLSVHAPGQRREATRTYDDDDINQRSFSLRMLPSHLSKGLRDGWTNSQSASQSTIQTDRQIRDPEKIAVDALRRREVPEATLPATPAEAEWWERVRNESIKIQKSYDRGGHKLVRLLKEGADNGYRVPIPDRGVTFLRRRPAPYTSLAKQMKISGGMALVAEFLPDGTVGEVKIVEGLPAGLNESATEATQKTVFLPAVKQGQFISSRLPMTMSFNTYQR